MGVTRSNTAALSGWAARPETTAQRLGRALLLGALSAGGMACAAGAPPAASVATPPRARESRAAQIIAAIAETTPKAKFVEPVKQMQEQEQEQSLAQELAQPAAAEPIRSLLTTITRCPVEMALVDNRVCIDRWEGSLVERSPGEERAWSPFTPVDGREALVRAVSRPNVIPQGYISGEQAMAACRASGKRLCTGDEWERACRGPMRTTFPYGEARRSGACNDDIRAVHPVVEVASTLGLDPGDWWRDAMNNPLINQLPASLLRTAERVECTNAYGVFDMVGNLHEWIDDASGTFRGGFYMDTSHNGDGCSYQTTAHNFRYHDYSTGFRCCMDPERVE